MASVTVFVDDAVQGRFPGICVSSGAPADRRIRFEQRVGGSSPLLLLLIVLGPIGWLALLLLSGRGERLDVFLPVSDAITERWKNQRLHRQAALIGVAMTAVLVFTTGPSAFTLGSLAVAGVWALAAHTWLYVDGVGIDLGASRRWVTLKGVDESFAAAVRDEQANRPERSRY
jgi:hypothetical protein